MLQWALLDPLLVLYSLLITVWLIAVEVTKQGETLVSHERIVPSASSHGPKRLVVASYLCLVAFLSCLLSLPIVCLLSLVAAALQRS